MTGSTMPVKTSAPNSNRPLIACTINKYWPLKPTPSKQSGWHSGDTETLITRSQVPVEVKPGNQDQAASDQAPEPLWQTAEGVKLDACQNQKPAEHPGASQL